MSFRRFAGLVVGIVLAVLSAGVPGFPQAAAEEITYTMPPGWAAQPVQGAGPDVKAHYVFLSGGRPYGEMYLYGPSPAAAEGLEATFNDGLTKLRPNLPYYQARGTLKMEIDGRPAIRHEFAYMPAGSGVMFAVRTYTLLVGQNVYTFFFQGLQTYGAAAGPYYDAVMASVTAAPKPAPVAPLPTVPESAPRRNPAWATPKRVPTPKAETRTEGGLPVLAEEPAPGGLYTDPFGRYTVKLPETAVHQKTEDNAAWFQMPQAKTAFIIHNCPGDGTVASLAARFAAGKKEGGAPTVLTVDGREATVALFTAPDAAGLNMAWVTAGYKGSGLLIVVSLPAKDYAGAQDWIGGLLRGVRFNAR